MLRLYTAFVVIFLSLHARAIACGYSFVGDCSTYISLKINGTLDSFAVAPCPNVLKFDGFSLGSLQSLAIARARATTWESCQNNVSGVSLFYRVYEQGFPGNTWSGIDLQEDYNTLAGPYTTRYRSVNTNTDLTDGLVAGKTYILEIYFAAQVDTVGDDFIPETTLLQNNNGQNYRFTFQYGGAEAPPFVVAATKMIPVKCHGDSTGVAGVTVYGNAGGLFYQWSTGGNNYPILSHIPAGSYSVTVTGTGGYTTADTIDIAEPAAPLSAQLTVSGLDCGGIPGYAIAEGSGGTAPYSYSWSDGQQTAAATFPLAGAYAVTVKDANKCAVAYPVNIGAAPFVPATRAVEICAGGSYAEAGMTFGAAGAYDFVIPGENGACDTAVHLIISVLDPAAALKNLPQGSLYVCAGTVLNFCPDSLMNTQFFWQINGVPQPPQPCLSITDAAPGLYWITAVASGAAATCYHSQALAVFASLPPAGSIAAGVLTPPACVPADTVELLLQASGEGDSLSFQWVFKGQTVAAGDSCFFAVSGASTELPDLIVTDVHGCSSVVEGGNFAITQPAPLQAAPFVTNPAGGSGGAIALDVGGGTPPYAAVWSNGDTGLVISNLAPGLYCATVTDGPGCSLAVCATLMNTAAAGPGKDDSMSIFPNPASAGGQLHLALPERFAAQEIRLEILDLPGRTLLRQVLRANGNRVSCFLPEAPAAALLLIRVSGADGGSIIARLTVR